jgi:hypothetical protein
VLVASRGMAEMLVGWANWREMLRWVANRGTTGTGDLEVPPAAAGAVRSGGRGAGLRAAKPCGRGHDRSRTWRAVLQTASLMQPKAYTIEPSEAFRPGAVARRTRRSANACTPRLADYLARGIGSLGFGM